MTEQKRRSTQSNTIKIYEFLKEVLEKDEEHKDLFKYSGSWDDDAVAKKFEAAPSTVKSIRREHFGEIMNSGRIPPHALLHRTVQAQGEKIVDLEKIVDNLLHELGKYNKLVTMLSLNKHLDCRHLLINGLPGSNGK